MAVQHKNLTAAQLHEPKGVSAASSGKFNLADTGANSWQTLHYSEKVTASASASIVFDDLEKLREVCLTFDDLLVSADTRLALTVSSNNGSSYLGTSSYYASFNQDTASVISTTLTRLDLASVSFVSYVTGKLFISNFNKALKSIVKGQMARNNGADLGNSPYTENLLGVINSATAWNALKITPVTGTLTSGTITLEGLKG